MKIVISKKAGWKSCTSNKIYEFNKLPDILDLNEKDAKTLIKAGWAKKYTEPVQIKDEETKEAFSVEEKGKGWWTVNNDSIRASSKEEAILKYKESQKESNGQAKVEEKTNA